MKKKVNPLTIQSKNWLANGLLGLMLEKNFNDISIKEIAEKAQLDRRTFYRHFSSKEELLTYYTENLSKEYFSALFANENLTIYTITEMYFEFWKKHIDFLTAVYNNNLQFFLLNSYNKYMPELYNKLVFEREHNIDKNLNNNENHRYFSDSRIFRYGLAFKIGGFWNILFEWVKDKCKLKPDEMAEIITEFIENDMLL